MHPLRPARMSAKQGRSRCKKNVFGKIICASMLPLPYTRISIWKKSVILQSNYRWYIYNDAILIYLTRWLFFRKPQASHPSQIRNPNDQFSDAVMTRDLPQTGEGYLCWESSPTILLTDSSTPLLRSVSNCATKPPTIYIGMIQPALQQCHETRQEHLRKVKPTRWNYQP